MSVYSRNTYITGRNGSHEPAPEPIHPSANQTPSTNPLDQ